MWVNFWLDEETHIEAKVFSNPSIWGINDGRVSKLFVYRLIDDEWEAVYEYDRGSEVGEIEQEVIDAVLERYP